MSDPVTDSLSNPVQRYPLGLIICHWVSASLIGAMIIVGLDMADMDRGPEKLAKINLHGSLGTTLLAVMALRFWFRVKGPLPPEPDSGSALTNGIAKIAHWGFYLLVLGMVLGGIVTVWTVDRPIYVFGLIEIASPLGRDIPLHQQVEEMHKAGYLAVAGFIVLHVAAVFYHMMLSSDGFIGRIFPGKNADKDQGQD